jgi:CMP-N,N'-diacetyllegionaminic acid synthase
MKIHAILLARGGSKGIKNKNLILLNKKPLIYWSIKAALITKKIQNVWVSSDSKKILNYAKINGAIPIKRPKYLSNDKSSSEDGWLHAIKKIKETNNIDYVVALQATSPIRGVNDLNEAIDLFINKKCDSLFSTSKRDAHFTWDRINNKLIPNYNLKLKRKRRQSINEKFIENGSFYIFSANKFLKRKKRIFGKIINYNQNKIKSFELDNMDDLQLLKTIFKNSSNDFKIIK